MSLRVHVEDHVAQVVIARPQALNAIDQALIDALHDAWRRLDADDEVRVVVLSGEGDKAFSAGADLKHPFPSRETVAQDAFAPHGSALRLADLALRKPLIAAIRGYALGAGLELALACDIRLAGASAVFGLPEVRIGSLPGAGGTQRLIRAIGRSDAMYMLLTGARVGAREALRMGLVSAVFDDDALPARAAAMAQEIAQAAPLAVAAVKRLAQEGAELPLASGLRLEEQAFHLIRDSADRAEGREAFRARRAPRFRGR